MKMPAMLRHEGNRAHVRKSMEVTRWEMQVYKHNFLNSMSILKNQIILL